MPPYPYIGPRDILEVAQTKPGGYPITTPQDLLDWLDQTAQQPDQQALYWVTYTVSQQSQLHIADRHSEHVACASAAPVLAAGEMAFRLTAAAPAIEVVTNMSTGYCPEPSSWSALHPLLTSIGFAPPDAFTTEIIFRKCPACGQRNVVKDDWYYCGVCDTELPQEWNF